MPARGQLDPGIIRRRARFEHPLGRQDGKWYTLFKEFTNLPPVGAAAAGKDPDWSITGVGIVPTPTFIASATNAKGGFLLATRTASAADADTAKIFPFTGSRWGQTLASTTGNVASFEVGLRTGASIAATGIVLGFTLTDMTYADPLAFAALVDADFALWSFNTVATTGPATSLTKWAAVTNVNASITAVIPTAPTIGADISVVAAATDYIMRVEIGTDRKARYYINGSLLATSAAATTATAAFIPTVVFITNTNGAKSHAIRWLRLTTYIA